jgi:hypothetical protein
MRKLSCQSFNFNTCWSSCGCHWHIPCAEESINDRHCHFIGCDENKRCCAVHLKQPRGLALESTIDALYREIYGLNATAEVELDAGVPRNATILAEAKMYALGDALGNEIGLRTAQAYFTNEES